MVNETKHEQKAGLVLKRRLNTELSMFVLQYNLLQYIFKKHVLNKRFKSKNSTSKKTHACFCRIVCNLTRLHLF